MPLLRHTALAACVAALACVASQVPEPAAPVAPVDARTPLERMVDEAKVNLNAAATASDQALTEARLAGIERSLDRARTQMSSARTSAQTASQSISAAVESGDRIRDVVGATATKEGRGYAHYWALGRAKLDTARAYSSRAIIVADSGLVCTAAACASRRAAELQTHLQALSGATRDAESLLRVALLYVH